MIIFVTVVIGRCWNDSVRRRSWLGLAGVLLVVAAGLAAYGINSAFGKRSRRKMGVIFTSRFRVPHDG